MKWITPIILLLIFSGCAMLGTNMIHSPSSAIGTPLKDRHVHGGATNKAPANAIIFKLDDSSSVIVGARTIWTKNNFGGILLPIFPVFWLPRIDNYKDQPHHLIIEVTSVDQTKGFEILSAVVNSNNRSYELNNISHTGKLTELEFLINAEQTSEFTLSDLKVKINDEVSELPIITFKRMKQHWRFIGP